MANTLTGLAETWHSRAETKYAQCPDRQPRTIDTIASRARSYRKLEDQRRVIGQPGDPLIVGIVDGAGERRETLGQKGMVDAEPVTLGAKPEVFTSLWVALTPQVAKRNSLDRIRIKRCPIDRPPRRRDMRDKY